MAVPFLISVPAIVPIEMLLWHAERPALSSIVGKFSQLTFIEGHWKENRCRAKVNQAEFVRMENVLQRDALLLEIVECLLC